MTTKYVHLSIHSSIHPSSVQDHQAVTQVIQGSLPHNTIRSCGLVQQQWFASVLDFWDGAFEIKSFAQYNLEYLLDVDTMTRTAKN